MNEKKEIPGLELKGLFKEFTHTHADAEGSEYLPGYCRVFPIDEIGNVLGVHCSWNTDSRSLFVHCSLLDPVQDHMKLVRALEEAGSDVRSGVVRPEYREWLGNAIRTLWQQLNTPDALQGNPDWNAQVAFTGKRREVGRTSTPKWPGFLVALDVEFGRVLGEKRSSVIEKASKTWPMGEETIKKALTEWSGTAEKIVQSILVLDATFGVSPAQSISDYQQELRRWINQSKGVPGWWDEEPA